MGTIVEDVVSLKTNFTNHMVAKLISKFIKTKLGKNMDIGFEDIEMRKNEQFTLLHVNGYIRIDSKEFEEMIEEMMN